MIEGIHGTIGSGKSQLLNYRMVNMAIKGRDLALNFEYNEQGLYHALRRIGGFTHQQAMDCIRKVIIVRTYEQLRGLKNRWLGFDEGHFWFFSRMWERVQLADVQFWSLSRKLGVDVTIVTQRWGALDAVVRDLAQNVWEAKPLVSREVSVFPWDVLMSAYNMTFAQLSKNRKLYGMFMYTKVNDVLGSTKSSRKTLMGAVGNKSIVGLDLIYARAYDTGKFFTSPLIEEDARKQRLEYLKNIYFGHLLPLQTCAMCNGLGRMTGEYIFDGTKFDFLPFHNKEYYLDANKLVSVCDCPTCGGSGYFAAPSHDDVLEALKSASSGLLGSEARLHWLQHHSQPSDGSPPAAPGAPTSGPKRDGTGKFKRGGRGEGGTYPSAPPEGSHGGAEG